METKSLITSGSSWYFSAFLYLRRRVKWLEAWIGLVLTLSAMGGTPSSRPTTQPVTNPAVLPPASFPGKVLGEIRIPNFRDPSGIVFHPLRGTLFVIGDKGDIAEIRTDGTLVQQQRYGKKKYGRMDLEDVTCDPFSGRLYIAVEGSEKIVEVDPNGLRILREFNLDRQYNGKTVLESGGQGIEGMTFISDPKHPQRGRFILANQCFEMNNEQDASAIFTVVLPLRSNRIFNKPIPIDWYLRFPLTDISGLHYDAAHKLLLAISDANDRLMLLDLQGRFLAAYVLPGQDQEGVTLDKDGMLYIAQDSGGILKCRFASNLPFIPDAGAGR